MKKFISGLIAAFLLSAGFVAVSAETAHAACPRSSYVQCQPTSIKAVGPKVVKKGNRPKTGIRVKSQPGFGKENSSTIAIGDKLLVLTDTGELVLILATSEKFSELGRFQVCGKNWIFPALANGKLYVSDARELACFHLK